ncbi:hypothetical protein AB3S75_036119 [Citrus x aurantiifolia]
MSFENKEECANGEPTQDSPCKVHSVTKIKVAAVCYTTTGKPEPMSAFMGLGPIPIMPRGQNPVYLQ